MRKPSWSHIAFEIDSYNEDIEETRFIERYKGSVWGRLGGEAGNEQEAEEDRVIGEINLLVIQHDQAEIEGVTFFDVMDADSDTTLGYFDALCDVKSDYFKDEVTELIHEERRYRPSTMLIESIELTPSARGHGIGRQVAHKVIASLGASCGVISCCPYPLQFIDNMNEEITPEGREPGYWEKRLAASKKVTSICKRAGFVSIPGTDYLIWPGP